MSNWPGNAKRRLAGLVAIFLLAGPVLAQQDSMRELLQSLRAEQQAEAQRNQARLQEFIQNVEQREELLNQAQAALAAAQARKKELQAAFRANEEKLARLHEKLRERAGDFGEVFGVIRQVAQEARSLLNSSLTSVEMPERDQFLSQLAESESLPSLARIKELWRIMLGEMIASGEVSRFTHKIVLPDGTTERAQVVRAGTFNVSAGNRFLTYNAQTDTLSVLPRQPAERWREYAAALAAAESGASVIVPGVVDPSQGAILSLLIQKPSLVERIHQGQMIGYITLALGIIGLLIALERFLSLTWTSYKMRRQRSDLEHPSTRNPLGLVLQAYHNNRDTDVETMQLKLDQAILRSIPSLEWGLPTMRVISAVAPLLGLLGTVVGMIATFQTITLFGTGDPAMMADGITQALVTTVLGLVVAVPMVLLHSMLNARSRRLIQTLEQQSSGLVAAHAEGSVDAA